MNTPSEEKEKPEIKIDEEELKRFNKELIESELITPDKIYVDLVLCKDVNIGAILSFLKERKSSISKQDYVELYKKIIQKLPEYNERKFDDFETIFSFMDITNQQIKERLEDPLYAGWIFYHAPITNYIKIIAAQLALNANHSAVIGKRSPIEITVNTYPLQLTKEYINAIGHFFTSSFGVNVKVLYLDMTNLKLSDIYLFDEIYTYFFKEIFDVEEIRTAYSSLKFVSKRLYVTKLFGSKNVGRDTEQEALYIQSRLDILTQFKMVHPRLFSAPPVTINAKEANANG